VIKLIARLSCSLLVALLCFTQGCCDSSSETGAARARQLSPAQLRALYTQMEEMHRALRPGEIVEWTPGERPLPEPFAQTGALFGDVGHLDRLVYGGCMDDKAFLHFEGLDGRCPRRIRQFPGERIPSEVVWSDASN